MIRLPRPARRLCEVALERMMMPTIKELGEKLDKLGDALHEQDAMITKIHLCMNSTAKEVSELKIVVVGPNSDDGLALRIDRIERVVSVLKWVAIVIAAPLIVGAVGAFIYLVLMHPLSWLP
jgi:hypothetical protein